MLVGWTRVCHLPSPVLDVTYILSWGPRIGGAPHIKRPFTWEDSFTTTFLALRVFELRCLPFFPPDLSPQAPDCPCFVAVFTVCGGGVGWW